MRDFHAGGDINVGGDVYIHDQSIEHKLLIHCANDELHAERTHRKMLLRNERFGKVKRLALLWLVVTLLLCAGALWLYWHGQTNFSALLLGGGGITCGLVSVKTFEQPTEFEMRQIAALNEIKHILRERGAE
ncbi:hypothetical protein [Dyella mobilis]|uniref:Uncharacterized protein n=1 Tax=Dyella mobilis TaxID=1849582 RepID=A0ABS2KE15_9GAMM|nr:hypothetical protein [Dyella mobilis]MBM7129405.1 hypothetical protein [Dyella mobilis]GLQ98330.1 hypothetical protein GCM10007863_27500 [Dyella mobilis]